MDRADSLSGIAKHLERRVSDYITTNYPFQRPCAAAVEQFFNAIPDPSHRSKIASGNAETLFRLGLA
jgi:hypothetical protein